MAHIWISFYPSIENRIGNFDGNQNWCDLHNHKMSSYFGWSLPPQSNIFIHRFIGFSTPEEKLSISWVHSHWMLRISISNFDGHPFCLALYPLWERGYLLLFLKGGGGVHQSYFLLFTNGPLWLVHHQKIEIHTMHTAHSQSKRSCNLFLWSIYLG